jgi:hypothetical protein
VARLAPAGQAIPAAVSSGLLWSPDGSRLAFASVDASGALTLRILTVAGTDTTRGAQTSAPITLSGLAGAPVWSASGQGLTWVARSAGGGQSVWALRNGATTQVASQADPSGGQASIAQLGWSGAAVTWATQDSGQITGVFAAIPGATSATRLTPTQARYSAAALNASGEWLLAGHGALWRVTPDATTPTWAAALTGQISQIVWAPDGQTAALLASDGSGARLALWSSAAGLQTASGSAASDAAPVWSADSQWLAYVASGQAIIARIQGGQSLSAAAAGAISAPASLAWSPDGAAVAITDARGVYLATRDGLSFTFITSRAPSASALLWSTAG